MFFYLAKVVWFVLQPSTLIALLIGYGAILIWTGWARWGRRFVSIGAIFLLVVGCMMDIFSAIVIVVPIMVPVALTYGIDPIHLCIIFLVNLEIGYSTPPVGINLFIASQRFGRPILSLFRAAVPFLVLMVVWLAMVTYIPAISLWWQD